MEETQMKRKRHNVVLVLSVGMIVGVWAALQADEHPGPGITPAVARAEEPNLPEGLQQGLVLVEATGPHRTKGL